MSVRVVVHRRGRTNAAGGDDEVVSIDHSVTGFDSDGTQMSLI